MESVYGPILASAIATFPIYLLEAYVPYPWLVEELVKLMIVRRASSLKMVLVSGFVFWLSETILMMGWNDLLGRVLLTLPMHLLTYVVLYYAARKKGRYLILGLLTAMVIHYWFNARILG